MESTMWTLIERTSDSIVMEKHNEGMEMCLRMKNNKENK